MKKRLFFAFIATVCLLFILPTIALATESTDSLYGEKNIEAELSEVKDSLAKGEEGIQIENEKLRFDDSYKLFTFTEYDIVNHYRSVKSIEKMLSDDFSWQIPTTDGRLTTVIKSEAGNWKIIGYAEFTEESAHATDRIIDKKALKDTIQKYDNVTNIMYLVSYDYYTTFVYLMSDGEEYLIPYCDRPDFTGLVNGTVYKPAEVMDTLEKNMGVPVPDKDEYGNGGGLSISPSPKHDYTLQIVLLSCGIVVLTVLVVFIIKKLKSHNR